MTDRRYVVQVGAESYSLTGPIGHDLDRLAADRIAYRAEQSQAQAQAYRRLARLIESDQRFAALREYEVPRMVQQADEYDDDAEDQRERALRLGYRP